MPQYQYECQSCGDRFDHVQSMKSGAKRKCTKCGKFKLLRLIGPGGLVLFKGDPQKGDTGFYALDYKRNLGRYDVDRQRENVREHDIQREDY